MEAGSLSPNTDGRSDLPAEGELWWNYRRTGRLDLRNDLVMLYEPWTAGRTRAFARRRGLDWTELRGAAAVGLIEAIERFDPSTGVPFFGFAVRRVDGALLDAARSELGGRSHRRATTRSTEATEGERLPQRSQRTQRTAGKPSNGSASAVSCRASFSVTSVSSVANSVAGRMGDHALTREEELPSRESDPADAAEEAELLERVLESMDDDPSTSSGQATRASSPGACLEPVERLREIARRRFTLHESVDEIGSCLGMGKTRVHELLQRDCLPRARRALRLMGIAPGKKRLPQRSQRVDGSQSRDV